MISKLGVILPVTVGLILVGVAVLYFVLPANLLPSFLPGYDPFLTRRHLTHGVGTLVLGFLAFALAWFQSGKKSS